MPSSIRAIKYIATKNSCSCYDCKLVQFTDKQSQYFKRLLIIVFSTYLDFWRIIIIFSKFNLSLYHATNLTHMHVLFTSGSGQGVSIAFSKDRAFPLIPCAIQFEYGVHRSRFAEILSGQLATMMEASL